MPGQVDETMTTAITTIKAILPIGGATLTGLASAWSMLANVDGLEGMGNLVATAGVAGSIAIFSVVVGWYREKRMAERIDSLEKARLKDAMANNEKLLAVVGDNTSAMKELSGLIRESRPTAKGAGDGGNHR